jgi:outer membrane protein
MIKKNWMASIALTALLLLPSNASAKQWSLSDCINYAISNNITLQKSTLTRLSAIEDLKQSQAALLPSLNFSTSHDVTYRPWPETGSATVANGYVQQSIDKTYYNGSYGVNGNWTIWNGGRNTNTVKLNKLTAQQAELDSAKEANSLIEQISQLYVQILYSNDAISVNKSNLETSKKNENRGKDMVKVGKMSDADLAQLTAQRAQDEYSVVEAESNLKNYKRQLKQLLQITSDEEFDVVTPQTSDDMALQTVPKVNDVYNVALEQRPEIKNAKIGIQASDLSIKIAKAQSLPTLGLSGGFATNTTSMSSNAWGKQLKNNFYTSAGLTLSIPLFDNRSAKTAVNKAMIQRQNYMLDLKDKQTTLYSTIENYWLQAMNNQSQYKAAKVSTESAQISYNLLSEQFRLGLKNIVELMTGKNTLLKSQQSELQSKYLTILNIDMLNFYKSGEMK